MSDTNDSVNKTTRRKVQIVGGNTVTVSLPRSWADYNNIGRDEGDNDEIEIRSLPNGSLMVTPINSDKNVNERTHSHAIENGTSLDTLKRIILADFIGGIDLIRLKFEKKPPISTFNALHKFVDSRLIGFDLIDTETVIDVVNMTDAIKFEVGRLMEILRVQSKRMVSNCLEWITDETTDTEELIDLMDQWEIAVDRRTNQMMRTLQLAQLDFWIADKVNLPMAEILYWSTVTKSVESTADLAVAIAHTSREVDIDQIDEKAKLQISEMAANVTKLYSQALKSFIEDDYMASYQVLEEQSKTSTTIQKKWPTSIDHYSDQLILVMVYLEKISSHARKIAEASIDCEGAKRAREISSFYSS